MPPPGQPPTVRQRRIARALRGLRELAELKIEEAAGRMGWSPAKQSKIETARVGITVKDATKMLDLYGVENEQTRKKILSWARNARKRGWWDAYGDSLPSDYGSYIELESEAAALRCYDATMLNGLLQTHACAREIIGAALMALSSPAEIERRVEVRLTRQRLLTREDNPLQLQAVIDEPVLDRVLGSPDVMREQSSRLLELSEQDNVTIQVLPAAVGSHPALAGQFTLIEFPEPHDPDVVYIETMTSNLFMEGDADVYRYTLAFDHLTAVALSPDDSRERIAQRLSQIA